MTKAQQDDDIDLIRNDLGDQIVNDIENQKQIAIQKLQSLDLT